MKCPKCKKDNVRAGAVVDHILWLHCQHCSHCWSIYLLAPAMIEAVKITIIRIRKQKRFNTCKPLEAAFAGLIEFPPTPEIAETDAAQHWQENAE